MNPFIWVKDDALTAEFCKHTIAKFEADSRKRPGVIARGYFPKIKSSLDLSISLIDDWKKEDGVFFDALGEHIPEYKEQLDKKVQDKCAFGSEIKDEGYTIQKTQPGQGYIWHNDAQVRDGYSRVLTYIWYLNDVPEGGETEFWDGTLVKPVQGRVLMFPATWNFIHRGNAPATDRYIVVGWVMAK